MKLVVDASPLILLSSADQLSIFPALADEIVVPEAVVQELIAGEDLDRASEDVQAAPWVTFGRPQRVAPSIAIRDLGPGETAVLSWAEQQPGFTCVLDDRAARSCARDSGLRCVGTLGLVLEAREASFLPAARPILERMIRRAGYYLSEEVLEKALRKIGE